MPVNRHAWRKIHMTNLFNVSAYFPKAEKRVCKYFGNLLSGRDVYSLGLNPVSSVLFGATGVYPA